MSGVKPGKGEEQLGVQVNLGEKLSLEKERIDVLNVFLLCFLIPEPVVKYLC